MISYNYSCMHHSQARLSYAVLALQTIMIIREGLKKIQDKLGLLAEPPLTPPPHPNLGPVIWFGNVFWHVKDLENKPYNRLGLSNPL